MFVPHDTLDLFHGSFLCTHRTCVSVCLGVQVVCKYIEDPVLFRREDVGMVKFDIRYMLMLRSVQPLRLYAYDVFWLRFANRCVTRRHFTLAPDSNSYFLWRDYGHVRQPRPLTFKSFN